MNGLSRCNTGRASISDGAGYGRGVPGRRRLAKEDLHRRTPRDCLSCHARRAPGTGWVRVGPVGRRTPEAGHAPEQPGADLLEPGVVRAGVVPQTRGSGRTRGRVRHQPGHRLPLPRRSHRCTRRTSPRPARNLAASQGHGLHPRHPRWEGLHRRPLRGEDHQRQRRGDRLVVFRESPRTRRQHPGTVGTQRVPAMDQRRRTNPARSTT